MQPRPGSVGVDPAVALTYARAGWLGRASDDKPPVVSFTSLFLALAWGNDGLARWIRATADELGLAWDHVLARWSSAHQMPPRTVAYLEQARSLGPAALGFDRSYQTTPSARDIADAGRRGGRLRAGRDPPRARRVPVPDQRT